MHANTLEDICDVFLDTMINTNQVMLYYQWNLLLFICVVVHLLFELRSIKANMLDNICNAVLDTMINTNQVILQ